MGVAGRTIHVGAAVGALIAGVQIGTPSVASAYSGVSAAYYANLWALNDGRSYFGDDCTDFVSQSINYGGLALIYGSASNPNVWYLNVTAPDASSYSWATAGDLKNFLVGSSGYGASAGSYELGTAPDEPTGWLEGDVSFYSWAGNGVINHSAIKEGNSGTYSTIDQHTPDLFAVPYTYAGVNQNTAFFTSEIYLIHIG